MKLKQYTIGKAKPLIIVPVTETGQEEILNAARQAVCQGVDALEWRIDWFEQASHWSRVQEILLDLAKICEHKILLCTFRTRQQGGQRELTEEVYLELLEEIAKSGLADLLDVEVPQLSDVSTMIGQLQNAGQRVIGSSHYFSGTPETDQMKQELMEMYRAGADIAKLAVMPKSRLDVLRLMEVTAQVKEEIPDYPLVTMAMGGLGAISRVSGQLSGSCMTFASIGKASAPGQLTVKDTAMILDKISESMDHNNEI
ncbi:MAG: type I 3-dehydroquinate dehydratase [Lachnospiraceae bacterium]|jgi:3-dehydroquinate dehydratase-1|nr:type I 3-dehydroquinate dehydratase [Lachnospiraceae bacterium]